MKRFPRSSAILLLTSAIISGCATTEKMDQPTYERLLSQAKQSIAKSDSVKYTWTNSEDAITKADEAAKAGDWATAIREAKKAREFSELAYEQYEAQKNAGPALD